MATRQPLLLQTACSTLSAPSKTGWPTGAVPVARPQRHHRPHPVPGRGLLRRACSGDCPYDPLAQNLRDSQAAARLGEGGSLGHPWAPTTWAATSSEPRHLWGTRVSLTVGFFGVLIAAPWASSSAPSPATWAVGSTAIMAVVNLVLSLPYLLFVVVIAAILGRSLVNVILIFGIT
jgi:ABC-type dipeptide/oligopeptide/nickel transport system permease subunit